MSASADQTIPDDILRHLEELRPCLERSGGSIRPRPDGGYSLRIRVEHPDHGQIHRSIRVGDEETAYAVRQLINSWRREYDAPRAEEKRKREEKRAHARKLSELKRAILCQARGPSHRRRLAREFNEAAKDPVRFYSYLLGGPGAADPPIRRGRQSVGRLS